MSYAHSLYMPGKTFLPESTPVQCNESVHPMYCIPYKYFPSPVDPCATPLHQDTRLGMVSRLLLGCPRSSMGASVWTYIVWVLGHMDFRIGFTTVISPTLSSSSACRSFNSWSFKRLSNPPMSAQWLHSLVDSEIIVTHSLLVRQWTERGHWLVV